ADAASARLTSPAAAAAALTGVNVIAVFLQARYWPDLHRKADQVAQPSFAPYAQMGEAIGAGIDADAVRSWLEAAMVRRTSVADPGAAAGGRLAGAGKKPPAGRAGGGGGGRLADPPKGAAIEQGGVRPPLARGDPTRMGAPPPGGEGQAPGTRGLRCARRAR